MARDAPPSSARSSSPTKRRMAPPSSSNAVWDALETTANTAASGGEATPRRRLGSAAAPGGQRGTTGKSRLKGAFSHEEDLEDGMSLISSFGGMSLSKSDSPKKPNSVFRKPESSFPSVDAEPGISTPSPAPAPAHNRTPSNEHIPSPTVDPERHASSSTRTSEPVTDSVDSVPEVQDEVPPTPSTPPRSVAPSSHSPASSPSSTPPRPPPTKSRRAPKSKSRRIIETDSESEDSWENVEPPSDAAPAAPNSPPSPPGQMHRGKPLFLDSASDTASEEANVEDMLAPSDDDEENEDGAIEGATRDASTSESPAPARNVRKGVRAQVKGRRIDTESESEDEPAREVASPANEQSSAPFRSVPRMKKVIDLSSDSEPERDDRAQSGFAPLKPTAGSSAMARLDSTSSTGSNAGVLHHTRIPSSPVKLSSAKPPAETVLIHLESDTDSDSDGVGEPSVPRTKKNKRLSVWSTRDETEIIPVSSSSESESESDAPIQTTPIARRPKSPTKPKLPPSRPQPTASSSSRPLPSPTKGRAPSKKRLRELLVDYARSLYTSLNVNVFGSKLPLVKLDERDDPDSCEIVWSNTLKKTAGRAVISRTKTASGAITRQKVYIELATKVVDSEERIRHTLSHEMCHLAVWVIDQVKEGDHGPSFKAWANRVMRVRKDITITTRHSYEITYKYEWECVDCGQTYGRHSKSIRPAEQRCGRCKGKLRAKFDDTKKEVKMNGWTAFVKEQMAPMLASRPGISRGDAMKEIGKLWRARGGEGDLDAVTGRLGELAV